MRPTGMTTPHTDPGGGRPTPEKPPSPTDPTGGRPTPEDGEGQ